MVHKICSKHGETDHYHHKNGHWYCCACKYERFNAQRGERKLKAIAYKGGRCSACGYSDLRYPTVFEFHHLDPKTKEKTPSQAFKGSWDKCVKEIDKCVLLCANCHRIAHEED